MKISRRWINEYLNIEDVDIKQVEEKYTKTGTKVEGIEEVGKYNKIVVGKILEIEKHPDAEKLVVTKVKVGEKEEDIYQIVTGANNISVGDIIPVALIGAVLPNGLEIKAGKLRGIDSNGMMCSCGELNLPLTFLGKQDSYGIMMLPKEWEEFLGTNVEKLFNIADEIIDFEITPNRPDQQGTSALIKELAVALDRRLKEKEKGLSLEFSKEQFEKTFETVEEIQIDDSKKLTVEIADESCTRYMMAVVKEVKIEESPEWLQERLKVMGTQSINNIVDLTNYVMFETGNPLHAFDLEKVSKLNEDGNICIKVEKAEKGSKIELLDDSIIELEDEMMIKNGNHNLVLAGIMGGKETGIAEDTKNVLLEVAGFRRQKIRRESRKHNLRSESSSRFEKNLPLTLPEFALTRFLKYVEKMGIGKVEYKIIDLKNYDEKAHKEEELKEKEILLDVERINEILGIDIEKEYMVELFGKLEFEVLQKEGKTYVKCPYLRNDISNIQDLAEEVIRFYGYENLKETLPKVELEENGTDKLIELKRRAKNALVFSGYNQVMTYGFISKEEKEKLGIQSGEEQIEVLNKLSSDYEIMRNTHVPSMLKVVSYNEKNKNEKLKIFEIAKVFRKAENISKGELPEEVDFLTMVSTAPKAKYKNTFGSQMEYVHKDIYVFKSEVEKLMQILDFRNYVLEKEDNNEIYHKAQCVNIKVGREIVGTFGKIHPRLIKTFELNEDIYIAELNMEAVKKYSRNKYKFEEITKFPKVTRDISMIVDEKTEYSEILLAVQKSVKNILEKVTLFDIYKFEEENEENKGKKSVSIKLEMRNKKKTLEENEIIEAVDKIIASLEKNLGAVIRKQ